MPGGVSMGLRYDEISEILKLIDGSSCDEFVLETEDIRLVVRRQSANGPTVRFEPTQGSPSFPAPSATVSPPQATKAPATIPAATHDAMHVVCAPMVGTFYRSPSPGTPAFIEVGAKVKKGDPICIIEVMKLFTTIHAEWSGTVAEVGAENAQLVEYGQMLFVIAPD